MKIKKMLLLASMALAAIAFAAPAAAQAELTWSSEGTFEVSGDITSEGSGLVTGPADVDIHGELFNAGGMGSGLIDTVTITGVAPTNLPGCHAVAQATASHATPWPITLTTEDTIDIGTANDTVTFINHYTDANGPGCPAFKVPATVPAEGIVTGTIENDGEGNACIDLNNHVDDMVNELSGAPVDLTSPNGPLCIEGVEVE